MEALRRERDALRQGRKAAILAEAEALTSVHADAWRAV